MVTKIRAMVTLGVRRVWVGVLDKNLRGGGGDRLSFSDLDSNDLIINYQGGSR